MDAPLAAYTAQHLRPDGTLDVAGLAKALQCHPDDPLVRIVECVLRMSSIRDDVHDGLGKLTTATETQLTRITSEASKQHSALIGSIRADLSQWKAQRDTLGVWVTQATEASTSDREKLTTALAAQREDNGKLRNEIAAMRKENEKLQKSMTELETGLSAERVQRLDYLAASQGLHAAAATIPAAITARKWSDVLWGLAGPLLMAVIVVLIVLIRTAPTAPAP